MWIILTIIFVVSAVAAVLLPLFKKKPTWIVESMEKLQVRLDALLDQKERALRRLKDLDLEKEAGSLTEAEYEQLRGEFIQDVVMVNRRIEELQGGAEPQKARSPELQGKV